MTEEFPELSAREQHLNLAETIIGPIFYDDERTQQLREDPSQLIASELGMRAVFLDVTYRELATRRYADRQLAKEVAGNAYDGPSFTDQWQLSDRHLEDIVEEHTSPTSLLRVAARQLTLINNAESSNEAPSGLRERQKTIKRQLVDGLQTPPNVREVLASSAPLRNIAKGISVKSPTGTGKSAMEGDFVRSAGIGQRARGLFPDRLRALNIVPSVALGDQVQGWRGKRTFQRLAGNEVTVTGKYEGNDDVTGDVVVATTNQVRSEAIDPHEFDAVIFDETQHLLGRQLSVAYREGKLGPLVIGYTATDEYGDGRHVGRLLPYRVDGGSIVECIKEGILNHAQLFSFRVPLDTLAPKGARHELIPEIIASKATQQAIDQAAQLAATGRRIAMYASPGGKSRHARYMADQLDGRVVTMPDGQEKILNAKAVGKFQSKTENDAAMEGIDDHTVDIIVATDMLSEGWDADIDAVLIIRRAHSRLWVEQVVGRGTRTSEEFPVSIYMEWLPILRCF
jgi:superfamily II DNA or RNA helicase